MIHPARQPCTPIHDPPTVRQLEVLRFVTTYTDDNGYPPTIREIGRALRMTSTNGVAMHLLALQRRGLLKRLPCGQRAIAVTPRGRETLARAST